MASALFYYFLQELLEYIFIFKKNGFLGIYGIVFRAGTSRDIKGSMGFYICVTSDILYWSDALPLGAFLRIPFADDKSPIFELQVVRLDADTTH